MSSKFVNSPTGVWKESNSAGGIWKWDTQGFIPNTSTLVFPLLKLYAYDIFIVHADAELTLVPLELSGQLYYNKISAELQFQPLELNSLLRNGNTIRADLVLPFIRLEGHGTQIDNYALFEFEPLELEGYSGMEGSFVLEPLSLRSFEALVNTGNITLEPLELEGGARLSNNHGRLTFPKLLMEGYSGGRAELVLLKMEVEGYSQNPISCHGVLRLPHMEYSATFGSNGSLELLPLLLNSTMGNSWYIDGLLTLQPLSLSATISNSHRTDGVLVFGLITLTGNLDYQAPFNITGQLTLPRLGFNGCLSKVRSAHSEINLPSLVVSAELSTPNPCAGEITLVLLDMESTLYQGDLGYGVCLPTETFLYKDEL
jgi:hypothetical protein